MTNTIYVFSGYSGAGKDTAAAAVPNSINIKFSAPAKRALEKIYTLPEGFLDDRELRQQIAPHSGMRTYLEVLIDFWKHRDQLVGADFFPQQVKEQALAVLGSGQDVTITDLRNWNESAVLQDLVGLGYTLRLYWVFGGRPLLSDALSLSLVQNLRDRNQRIELVYLLNPKEGIASFQQQVRDRLPK
jgi:hypothetical protein